MCVSCVCSSDTKLVIIDHISSNYAIVLPVKVNQVSLFIGVVRLNNAFF